MHRKKFAIASTILSLVILACQASGLIATPTPPPPTLTATSTLTPTPTASPTPTAFLAEQTSPISFPAGGFNFAPIRGYERDLSSYRAILTSPDEQVRLVLEGDTRPPGVHINTIMKSYMEAFAAGIHEFSQGERRDVTIDGVEGISADYTGTLDEQPVKGRLTILAPEDSKLLTIVAQAIGENRWDREGELAYSAIIKNLSLFRPEISVSCPIAKDRDYGYTQEKPIKVGGGADFGSEMEKGYLSVLLGPRGEIVGYYWDESVEVNGVILDKYTIRFGNTYKTLYFDMYNDEELQVPFGLNCSTILPR
ncbi:MAG: hypothetical protein HZB19_16665 [Chloroflexi bacterium]|nr:hypothetical protein [Chloroflexota bacterium]